MVSAPGTSSMSSMLAFICYMVKLQRLGKEIINTKALNLRNEWALGGVKVGW